MRLHNKKGALMLMLLVVIVVIGILAIKAIPEETTIVIREKEDQLSLNLSQMRQGLALERMASVSALYYGNFENQAEFKAYLDDLVARGFLSSIPDDPNCPQYLWGTGPGQKFWIPTRNLLGSSSFEIPDFSVSPWTIDESNVAINLSTEEWPGKDSPCYDNFPHQNLFGQNHSYNGTALAITQK